MIHYLRYCCAMLFALFSFLLATPLSAQAQTREAYVSQSADKTTLTFYYDALRATRTGTTWGIEETKQHGGPAWAANYDNPDTITTKVVFDKSFKDFRPQRMGSWFRYCKALKSFDGWDNLNTSEVTDMSCMFYGCEALETLDLSTFNTEKVTSLGHMFRYCKALKSVNLSSFNTEQVTDMSCMFNDCVVLEKLDLKNFNTRSLTDLSCTFAGCFALTSLDVSHFDTRKVTDMNGLFSGCQALTSLDLKNFNTENVTSMRGMFNDCQALRTLDVSSLNTAKVTDMEIMFAGCQSLPAFAVSHFNTEAVTNMRGMFQYCKALSSLDLSNFNTQKVTDLRGMFQHCTALATINSNTTWQCPLSEDMFVGCTQLKGAVAYDASMTDVKMANPETGYFTTKPTTVKSVRFGANAVQHIYTLQGKRVRGEWKHLPAGVYIVNGKKTVKP